MSLFATSNSLSRKVLLSAVPVILLLVTPMVTVAQQFPLPTEDSKLHAPGRCAGVIARNQIGYFEKSISYEEKGLEMVSAIGGGNGDLVRVRSQGAGSGRY